MLYTFEFVGVEGRIAHFDLGAFTDDLEARSFAKTALFDHATALHVDVWNGSKRLFRIDRPSDLTNSYPSAEAR